MIATVHYKEILNIRYLFIYTFGSIGNVVFERDRGIERGEKGGEDHRELRNIEGKFKWVGRRF